jgi:hypothetical protein
MGSPTSSYATASIALMGHLTTQAPHYFKVGIPSGVTSGIRNFKMESGYKEETEWFEPAFNL